MATGESPMTQAETLMTKELSELVGYTVVRPVFSHLSNIIDSRNYVDYSGLYPGLLLRNEAGKQKAVWFLRDEEDNGAGYYDIQEVL